MRLLSKITEVLFCLWRESLRERGAELGSGWIRENTVPTHSGGALKGRKPDAYSGMVAPRGTVPPKRSHHKKVITSGQHLNMAPRAPEF